MDKIDKEFAFWTVICAWLIIVSLGFGFILGVYNSQDNKQYELNKPIKPNSSLISSNIIKNDYQLSFNSGSLTPTICFNNTMIATIATGDSMVPSIYSGQRPLYREVTNTSELKVGDVIAYTGEKSQNPFIHNVVSHRIIEIGEDEEGEYFITIGDNNPVADGKIRPEQIEYIVVGIIY
jgi:signal peptidase I